MKRALQPTAFAAVIVAFALLGSPGCGSQESLSEHLANAEALFEAGELKEASIELRNALKLDPQNAETNFKIAELMERQGQLEDAIFFFGEAHRLDPERTDAAVREAGLLIFDDPVRVKELLDDVLARDPSNVGAYVVRSRRAIIEVKVDDALAHVLTALELDPDDQASLIQLGKVHQARIRQAIIAGKVAADEIYQEAIDSFDRAIGVGSDPRLVFIGHAEKAKVLSNWEGHTAEAEAAYRSAVEAAVETGDPAAMRNGFRAAQNFALRGGNHEFTMWILERKLEVDPSDASSWTNLAVLRKGAGGDFQDVIDRMLETMPEAPGVHTWYANFLAKQERVDEAVTHLETKIDDGVEPPVLLAALANLLQSAGRTDQAAEAAALLQKEYPDHPRAIIVRARRAMEDGRTEEAAVALRGIVQSFDRPEAYSLLAEAERTLGNNQAALDAVERLLELNTSAAANSPAIRMRAQLQVALGACDAALRSYTALTRSGGKLSDGDRFLQARCLYEIGNERVGRAVLERLLRDGQRPAYAVAEWVDREVDRDPEKAKKLLEEALVTQPNSPALLSRMAGFDLQENRPQQALDRFNKAIESGKVSASVILDRARVLFAMGEIDSAERDALRAFEAQPNLQGASALLLTIYKVQGRTDEAIRSFEEAHAVGALRPPAVALLSKLHMQNGNDTRARELFEELLSTPETALPGVKNDMAYLLAKNGEELDRALELAQEAQRELAKRPLVADTLGYVYLKRGLYDPALQQFRYAIDLSKQDNVAPILFFHEGLALQGLGRGEEAIASFEKALAIDADFEDAAAALRDARASAGGANATSSS